MDEFAGHLTRTLREISQVEFTPEKTVNRDGHGRRYHLGSGQGLPTRGSGELGERTQVDMHTTLGRSGLETLDTLILAGIANTRADAIRWALDRIRERPASERLLDPGDRSAQDRFLKRRIMGFNPRSGPVFLMGANPCEWVPGLVRQQPIGL